MSDFIDFDQMLEEVDPAEPKWLEFKLYGEHFKCNLAPHGTAILRFMRKTGEGNQGAVPELLISLLGEDDYMRLEDLDIPTEHLTVVINKISEVLAGQQGNDSSA